MTKDLRSLVSLRHYQWSSADVPVMKLAVAAAAAAARGSLWLILVIGKVLSHSFGNS